MRNMYRVSSERSTGTQEYHLRDLALNGSVRLEEALEKYDGLN
jgi:hypothetical protein